MAIVKQCDLCGSVFRDEKYPKIFNHLIVERSFVSGMRDKNVESKEYDVCPVCAEKLHEFIESRALILNEEEML